MGEVASGVQQSSQKGLRGDASVTGPWSLCTRSTGLKECVGLLVIRRDIELESGRTT